MNEISTYERTYIYLSFFFSFSKYLNFNLCQWKWLQLYHCLLLRSTENLVVSQESHFPEMGLGRLVSKGSAALLLNLLSNNIMAVSTFLRKQSQKHLFLKSYFQNLTWMAYNFNLLAKRLILSIPFWSNKGSTSRFASSQPHSSSQMNTLGSSEY